MIKAKIKTFEIEKDFDSITFKPLIQIAIDKKYDNTTKKWKWDFPINKLHEVQKIIGVGLEFDKEEVEIVKGLCPGLKADISIPNFKGKSTIYVKEYPKIFRVIQKRKVENDDGSIEIKDDKHDVNKEILQAIWGVISKFPLRKKIKTETVITNIFNFLDIKLSKNKPRALRSTREYIIYFWAPIHVLKYFNCVNYYKRGYVERNSENLFEFQTKFEVIEQ